MTAVAGGMDDSFVVKQDGSVWGTGANHGGQLGDGTTTDRHSFVQAVFFSTSTTTGDDSPVVVHGRKLRGGVQTES